MKHLPTHVLLDLADDYLDLSGTHAGSHARRNAAMTKLNEIDTELLSRMPEGEFVTLVTGPLPIRKRENGGEWGIIGYWYQPVGFEPECYVRLAEAQAELAMMDDRLDDSSYYFYRD